MEANGNQAFRNQLELRIRALEKEGEAETEIAILRGLLDIHAQVKASREASEKIAKIVDSYPSLLWLIMKRPLSTIPYLLAIFIGLSSLYISDLREPILAEWGVPVDVFDITSERIIPVFVVLLFVGFLSDIRYRDREEKKK